MAAGFNRIILIGNLTRDPEYKQLGSGQAVCRLGLATNRQFKNRQTGNLVQEVCYIDIDVWGAQAESCRQYLKKGRPVLIEGRLKFDSWDQNGQMRSKHSVVADRVVFLGSSANAEDEINTAFENITSSNSFEAGISAREKVAGAMKDDGMPEPQNEVEKELFDQIGSIKAKQKKKGMTKTAGFDDNNQEIPTGEIEFKDQPPFEDDLPF